MTVLATVTALPTVSALGSRGSCMAVTKDAENGTALQLPHFDNSKAREELGLDFMDIRQRVLVDFPQ